MTDKQILLMHLGLCAAQVAVLQSGASPDDIEETSEALREIEATLPRIEPPSDWDMQIEARKP